MGRFKNYLNTFIMLNLATIGTSFGSWSFTESSYSMDKSKNACVAKVQNQYNDLLIEMPKDKTSFPVVKMINKASRDYIGAHFEGHKFIAYNVNNKIEFLFIPKSREELTSFIQKVKARSAIMIRKYFMNGSKLQEAQGNFSLSGSSAALNKVKDCLDGELVSYEQSLLLQTFAEELKSSDFSKRMSPSKSFATIISRGNNFYNGVSQYQSLKEEVGKTKEALSNATSDGVNINLETIQNLRDQISTLELRNSEMQENSNFYATAEQTIESMKKEVALMSAKIQSNDTEIEAGENKLASLKNEYDGVRSKLDSKESTYQSLKTSMDSKTSKQRQLQGSIKIAQDSIVSKKVSQTQLKADIESMERLKDEAYSRYQNRGQIKNDIRVSLYNKYGRSELEFNHHLESLKRQGGEANHRIKLLDTLDNHLQDILEESNDLDGLIRNIRLVKEDLDCFKKAKGKQVAKCLDTSIKNAKNSLKYAEREYKEASDRFCVRSLGCGKKDKAKKKAKDKVNKAKEKISQLNKRISIINKTGVDPQRDSSIDKLTKEHSQISNSAKVKVKRVNSLIDKIQSRELGRIEEVERLIKCNASVSNSCFESSKRAAGETEKRLIKIVERKSMIDTDYKNVSARYFQLKNDINTEVNGLDARLLKEYENKSSAILAKERQIFSLEKELAVLEVSYVEMNGSILSIANDLAQLSLSVESAKSQRDQASNEFQQFDNRTGYTTSMNLVSTLKTSNVELQSTVKAKLVESSKVKERKEMIAQEIEFYPAQITQNNSDIAQKQGELAEVISQVENDQENLHKLRLEAQASAQIFEENSQNIRLSRDVIIRTF